MHRSAEVSDPFSVNETDLVNAALAACGEVIEHEIFYLARIECVQIENAVDGEFNRGVRAFFLFGLVVISVHRFDGWSSNRLYLRRRVITLYPAKMTHHSLACSASLSKRGEAVKNG